MFVAHGSTGNGRSTMPIANVIVPREHFWIKKYSAFALFFILNLRRKLFSLFFFLWIITCIIYIYTYIYTYYLWVPTLFFYFQKFISYFFFTSKKLLGVCVVLFDVIWKKSHSMWNNIDEGYDWSYLFSKY